MWDCGQPVSAGFVSCASSASPVPRFVQINVTVLWNVTPFAALIDRQIKSAAAPPLSKEAFDRWVDNVGSVFLNPISIRWEGKSRNGGIHAGEQSKLGGY